MAIAKATIPGLANGTEYGVRLFVEGKFGYQTALEGATAAATPRAAVRVGDLPVDELVSLPMDENMWLNWLIVNQGNPNRTQYIGADGVFILAKDVYAEVKWANSASNSYSDSAIHTYLNNTFYNLLDQRVRNVIKLIKIPYRPGTGTGTTIRSGENGLSCMVFLLSCYETGLSNDTLLKTPNMGVRLSYFLEGSGAEAKALRIAYKSGTAREWATRSPFTGSGSTSGVCSIGSNGYSYGYSESTASRWARPAMVISPDLLVSANPNAYGAHEML